MARSRIWNMREHAFERLCWHGVIVSLILGIAAPQARSQSSNRDSSRTEHWYDQIAVNGLLSASYVYNFNHPESRNNQLRVFDVDANSIELDLAQFAIRRDASRGEGGFRIDLDIGPHIPWLTRSDNLSATIFDVKQAYVSYVAPAGNGLRFDLGKFVTPAGYEIIESIDGINDNHSRSYLFGYAIPFTHTGLRLTYEVSSWMTVMGMVANGWDNWVDNNSSKTLGAQILLTPVEGTTIALTGLTGPEQVNDDTDQRRLADLALCSKLSDHFTVALSADYGSEKNVLLNGSSGFDVLAEYADVTWKGVAAYVRWTLAPTFALIARGEVFDDLNGARTHTPQRLRELTITPEWSFAHHFTLRADLRYDESSAPVFQQRSAFVTTQKTASLNAIYQF